MCTGQRHTQVGEIHHRIARKRHFDDEKSSKTFCRG